MRKRAKMRLAVLGGMIAGAAAGCWLLDVLEAAAIKKPEKLLPAISRCSG